MTFKTFVRRVDNLVEQWRPISDSQAGPDREALQAIYDDVCEQGVHGLAEAMRQRDEALMKLHKKYLVEPRKEKNEKRNKG
jgi:hypothetical protein